MQTKSRPQETEDMMRQRYSAWCCRQGGTAQCSPVVMLGALALVILMMGGGVELKAHWTGFMQVVAVCLALVLCGVAVLLFRLAMLVVGRAPLPARAAEPVPEPGPERSGSLHLGTVTREEMARAADAPPDIPADAPGMAEEADRLAGADTGIVVSETGVIYELMEPQA